MYACFALANWAANECSPADDEAANDDSHCFSGFSFRVESFRLILGGPLAQASHHHFIAPCTALSRRGRTAGGGETQGRLTARRVATLLAVELGDVTWRQGVRLEVAFASSRGGHLASTRLIISARSGL